MTRDELRELANDNQVSAYLHLIRAGETSQNPSAYSELFGGGSFDSFADHPRKAITKGRVTSTAAGAYQFLATTWDSLVRKYGFTDFAPSSQDQAAIALIAEKRGAIEAIKAGDINAAIRLTNRIWASLPGSPYGQPTRTYEQASQVFQEYGGVLADEAGSSVSLIADTQKTQEVKPVGIFAALLPTILQMVPQLISVFGSSSDSEVAKRNQAAGVVVADTLIKATQASNLADAVGKLQSDPAALDAAHEAINVLIPQLLEVGGSGIDGARKSASAGDQIPFYKNPAVLITVLLVPLVYMVAAEILFNISGQVWSDDIKMMFVTAIVSGLLASITGFFLGSSLGSQKKDAALGAK